MTKHILHIHDQSLPPSPSSGGSNRLVHWLACEQARLGHTVSALSPQGTSNADYAHIKLNSFKLNDVLNALPDTVTDIEYHGGLSNEIVNTLHDKCPRLLSVVHSSYQGMVNSVFVSKSHAENNGKTTFIHNGVPENDFEFADKKSDFYLFLAKVKRSKKGVDTAIKLANKNNINLFIGGGSVLPRQKHGLVGTQE